MGNRLEKLKKKLSGDVRKRLYDAQNNQMVANITQPTKDLVNIELTVKQICSAASLMYQYYYIIFAKEVYRKINELTGETLLNELIILDMKWTMRGLDPALLTAIKVHFYPAYPVCQSFKLNISLLDSCDYLI